MTRCWFLPVHFSWSKGYAKPIEKERNEWIKYPWTPWWWWWIIQAGTWLTPEPLNARDRWKHKEQIFSLYKQTWYVCGRDKTPELFVSYTDNPKWEIAYSLVQSTFSTRQLAEMHASHILRQQKAPMVSECLTKEINLPAFYRKLLSAYKMTESPIWCMMLKFAPIMRIAPMRLQCVKKIPTQNLQFALLKFAPIIRRNCLASALNFTNNVMLLKGDSRYLRLSEHLHHIRSQNSNSTFSQCWGPKKPTGMSRNRM